MTREKPILFSSPMVKALLAGTKTVTRRIVKLRDTSGTYSYLDDDGWPVSADECGEWHRDRCPFGEAGTKLWVRETWREIEDPAASDSEVRRWGKGEFGDSLRFVVDYRADNPQRMMDKYGPPGWKPSIFMPRWAARITLEVESVRVERLQDVTEEDAVLEGFERREHFIQLWHKLNGKTRPWESNPFVWRVAFRRLTP